MAVNVHGRETYGFGGGAPRHRSTPGAPLADPTKNIGAVGQKYGSLLPGLTPASNWESMFHNYVTGGNTATGKASPAPAGTAAPSGAAPTLGWGSNNNFQPGGAPPVAPGEAPSLATIASGGTTPHQERWTSAPPLRAPDRSMPASPFMPRGPNVQFTVPKPLSSPTGNAGTDAAELDANKSIYSPGGTAGMWGGGGAAYVPQHITPNRSAGTGYESGDPNAILKQYQTPGTTSSYGWGNSFANG